MKWLALLLALSGCAYGQPSCADNPRNMQCMTADEISREANK